MTSILFNLSFTNNTILPSFFFLFLISDLYFLIPTVVKQIFNPNTELLIPIEIPTKEEKAEKETHLVTVETVKQGFNIIQISTSIFMLLTRQFISIYFVNEIIFCFIYVFQPKFLTYVFLSHDYIFSDPLLY